MLCCAIFIITFQAFGQQGSENRLNVLMIIADDLSSIIYNNEEIHTPNIDKLASQGRPFSRAYCQASLCNPSRASIMTGKRPYELGIYTNQPHFRGMYPRIKTIPEYFKGQGYYTVGLGKIFHNWGQAIEGDPQSWSEPQEYHYAAHYHDWYVEGRPYQLHFDLRKGPAVQSESVPDEAYLDGRIANTAITKLRELQETPFFMAVGFWKPHLPYNAPKKYWDLYDRNHLPKLKYEKPVKGVSDLAYVDSNEARSYADIDKNDPIPNEKKEELRHGYLASISYLDAQVGKVLDELERLDLTKNTIVVFLSDHGYHAGEHGQFGKWTNFEIGTRVPLIINMPELPSPGKVSNSIVELIDIYPTLLELCGVQDANSNNGLSGASLVPVLKDPEKTVKAAAISQITRPIGGGTDFTILGSTMRSVDFRYNIWIQNDNKEILDEELYSLQSDLFIVENLIHKPEYREVRETMKRNLLNSLK
tara:strand:- start:256 stop:1683 length:1428 start_codon:yes stop_codon:yes gene_type:complete